MDSKEKHEAIKDKFRGMNLVDIGDRIWSIVNYHDPNDQLLDAVYDVFCIDENKTK